MSLNMTVKVQISIFFLIRLKIQPWGLVHSSQRYKNLTAIIEYSDRLYNKKPNNNRDRHAEPSQLAWSTTAEPTQGLSVPHIAQRIQVSTGHFIPQVTGIGFLHHEVNSALDNMVHAEAHLMGTAICLCWWRWYSLMLKVRITKINVNTATGKEEGKKTVANVQCKLMMGVIMHYQV